MSAAGFYMLHGREVVRCLNADAWGRWFETADRHVAENITPLGRVSTVFVGLDHRHFGEGPPLIFETMVFGGPLDGQCDRSSTWAEAEGAHASMLSLVLEADESS